MFEIEKLKTVFAVRDEAIKKIEAKIQDGRDKNEVIS
jgi:hypothetical protein